MKRHCHVFAILVLAVAAASIPVLPIHAQTGGPAIFYTDLLSGPNTGGENNNGVIITIAGNNFGATQGNSTVTIGGGAVATYKTWSNTRIQVAVGAAAKTGTVVVTVGGAGSTCENHDDGANCGFTVRSGNLYYVSPSGSDSAAGSFTAPWATPLHAMYTAKAGDTIYLENGVNTGGACDGKGWHAVLTIGSSEGTATGTATMPMALVAYPGATATIGSNSGGSCSGDSTIYGIRDASGMSYFTVSGLVLRAPAVALQHQDTNWRIVNNDISCANPGAQIEGCSTSIQSSNVFFYGNYVHDIAQNNSKQGHAVYFTTDTNHVWAGWNKLHNNTTCYDMQFHSSPTSAGTGNDQYDLHVHDNSFDTDTCAGLNFATVDPSKGTVEAYNNVIWHTGLEGESGFADVSNYNLACIYAAGILNSGNAGSGTVQIYNNTMYDCGPSNTGYQTNGAVLTVAGSEPNVKYQLTNNVMYSTNSVEAYLAGDTGQITCSSKNDFYGNGGVPSQCASGNLNVNPQVVSTSTPNFSPQSGSPLLGAGSTSIAPLFDFSGNVRPSLPAIGAYDVASASTVSSNQPTTANPPTNVSVVVQ